MYLDMSEKINLYQGWLFSIIIFQFLGTRYFKKTSCFITAGGSNDSKINPKRIKGYVILPPLSIEIETAEIEFREAEAAGNLRNFAETNDESEETEAVKESYRKDCV